MQAIPFSKAHAHCAYNELLTEQSLSCYRIKGFSSLLNSLFRIHLLSRVVIYSLYRVDFTFGIVFFISIIILYRGSIPCILPVTLAGPTNIGGEYRSFRGPRYIAEVTQALQVFS